MKLRSKEAKEYRLSLSIGVFAGLVMVLAMGCGGSSGGGGVGEEGGGEEGSGEEGSGEEGSGEEGSGEEGSGEEGGGEEDPLPPTIGHTPSSLSFTAQEGQAADDQTLEISNDGTEGSFDYTLIPSEDSNWMGFHPQSGTVEAGQSSTITVVANCEGFAAGQYDATIEIVAPDADNSPQSVPVSLTCTEQPTPDPVGVIESAPQSLVFTVQEGQQAADQTLQISNAGEWSFTYTLTLTLIGGGSWLQVNPDSGTIAPSYSHTITLSATCEGLAAGQHDATVDIVAPNADNSPQSVPVILMCTEQIPDPVPVIEVDPDSLSFTAAQGVAADSQTFEVSNGGDGTLGYQITFLDGGMGWLGVNPASGAITSEETDTITVTATCEDLAGGDYEGEIEISSPSASNSPQTVAVYLTCASVQLSAGNTNTCAVLSDGTAQCWGSHEYGQLGNGAETGFGIGSNVPVAVHGIADAVYITVGQYHACALLQSGTVQCWGRNRYGQMGDGTEDNSSLPVAVQGISDVVQVGAGDGHTCALLESGEIWCWGRNYDGQLGDGTNDDSSLPVAVQGISDAVSLGVGRWHNCALLADGSARCWGFNQGSQLGDGTDDCSNVPVTVQGLEDAVHLLTGGEHNCVFTQDHSMKCWGDNYGGQLGDGTNNDAQTPVLIPGMADFVNMGLGNAHSCGVLSDGAIQCWGENNSGQLGNGANSSTATPVSVQGITDALSVVGGDEHSCAVLRGNRLKCWGDNLYGQLGDGTDIDSNVPVPVVSFAP